MTSLAVVPHDGEKPYTDADVELVASATDAHWIDTNRRDADGHYPCVCGAWWDDTDGSSWDEHVAEVALTALAAAGRLA